MGPRGGDAYMSKTITIELPDEVYLALEGMSRKTGRPVEVLALEWLIEHGPEPLPNSLESQRKAARSRLLKFAGIYHGADALGSDNERIDSDLANEYEGHKPGDTGS